MITKDPEATQLAIIFKKKNRKKKSCHQSLKNEKA
jgi:hypothetical protein